MKPIQSAAGDKEDEPGASSRLRTRFPGKEKKWHNSSAMGPGNFCNSRHISQKLLQQYFAKLPIEKSISVYPQNLWITLWMKHVDAALTWRGIRIFVTLPIFYKAGIVCKNNEIA